MYNTEKAISFYKEYFPNSISNYLLRKELTLSPTYSFERYLNIRSAHNPAWLEGGQRMAFLTDITGTPQVWSVDKNGGWPEQLTFFQEKVWTLSAAPDGKRLICTRDIGGLPFRHVC